MLLAEINGKACPEVEDIEDLLTSAVFGHLRLVQPAVFWADLFERAKMVTPDSRTLGSVLRSQGLDAKRYNRVDMQFWRSFVSYGEPDLLIQFSSPEFPPFFLLVEVKLNSSKSSFGENDQLAKYLRLLRDESVLLDCPVPVDSRFLIYLTRNFATEELKESILCCGLPSPPMFGLEWNDILQVAFQNRLSDPLLAEVAEFLVRRGLQRFSGIRATPIDLFMNGSFYVSTYFDPDGVNDIHDLEGSFYGG